MRRPGRYLPGFSAAVSVWRLASVGQRIWPRRDAGVSVTMAFWARYQADGFAYRAARAAAEPVLDCPDDVGVEGVGRDGKGAHEEVDAAALEGSPLAPEGAGAR